MELSLEDLVRVYKSNPNPSTLNKIYQKILKISRITVIQEYPGLPSDAIPTITHEVASDLIIGPLLSSSKIDSWSSYTRQAAKNICKDWIRDNLYSENVSLTRDEDEEESTEEYQQNTFLNPETLADYSNLLNISVSKIVERFEKYNGSKATKRLLLMMLAGRSCLVESFPKDVRMRLNTLAYLLKEDVRWMSLRLKTL